MRSNLLSRQSQSLEGGSRPPSVELEVFNGFVQLSWNFYGLWADTHNSCQETSSDAQSSEAMRPSSFRTLLYTPVESAAPCSTLSSKIPLLAALKRRFNTWRVVVAFNILVALVTLTINVSALVLGVARHEDHVLYGGDCETVDKITLYGHGVINVLSTALLAASNHAMQILASPSRYDVNISHSQGHTFSIGVQSLRNLRRVKTLRVTLWIILAVSSIPLHLVYNSVIYPMKGANEYKVAVVTPGFLNGAPFDLGSINNLTRSSSKSPFSNGVLSFLLRPDGSPWHIPLVEPQDAQLLDSLRSKYSNKQLKRMTNDECIKSYFVKQQVTHGNLIAVSDEALSNSTSAVWLDQSVPLDFPTNWMCRYRTGVIDAWSNDIANPSCKPGFKPPSPNDWAIGVYADQQKGDGVKVGRHRIDQCFAETVPSTCKLMYEPKLLAVVIAANAVKAVAMIATVLQYKQPVLVTIGDALASFLRSTDETTRGMCLATATEFASTSWEIPPRAYSEQTRRLKRYTGASRQQWTTTIVMSVHQFSSAYQELNVFRSIITMLVSTVLFASIYDRSNNTGWSLSGSTGKESANLGVGLDTASLVVLANLPQVLLSLNYLMLNRLVTCMAVSREWSMLAHTRKGLRTSVSQGEQRSTYWLQLPLKFAIPMILISTGLHYLAAQSLFFGSLRIYSRYDYGKVTEDYTGLGYAQNPAHVLLITLLLLYSAIVLWGKTYNKPGIPQGGFNSAVLSAACHPPAGETDVHLKPVQWGVVSPPDEEAGVGHCSFSSEEVSLPVEGQKYA